MIQNKEKLHLASDRRCSRRLLRARGTAASQLFSNQGQGISCLTRVGLCQHGVNPFEGTHRIFSKDIALEGNSAFILHYVILVDLQRATIPSAIRIVGCVFIWHATASHTSSNLLPCIQDFKLLSCTYLLNNLLEDIRPKY